MTSGDGQLLEIKVTKATLFLYEQELLDSLPRELLAAGLRRGKAIIRGRRTEEREKGRMERPTSRRGA